MDIEATLKAIADRNMRVESDKAWETSVFRRLCLCIVIYSTAVITLYLAGDVHNFTNAIVPPVAYYLSTLTLPTVKDWWIRNRFHK